jgi:nucleoside-diphosphate-sugar epimerase
LSARSAAGDGPDDPADAIVQDDLAHVARTVGDDAARLAGKRLFLTGGTGFFGKWLLASLHDFNQRLSEPCHVTVLTRDARAFAAAFPRLVTAPAVELLEGDVRTFVLPEARYDFVIHGATTADSRLIVDEPLAMADTIATGTRRVLELAAGAGAERLLFVSSGAVYGVQPPELERVPEDYLGGPDPLSHRSSYAEAKRYAELLCAIYHAKHALPVAIARPFAFLGPYQDLATPYAATDFIRDGLRGERIQIHGDGRTVRSYLYAADLAAALWRVLLRGQVGRAYNVGSDQPIAVADLARRVAAHFDPRPEVVIARQPVPGRLPDRYVPDVSRAERELGPQVQVGLDEALSRTITWHRARGQY